MLYKSTRGGVSGLSFEEALFSGYAADGGLLVPETIPELSLETLKAWHSESLTYPQVVHRIIRLFVETHEISDAELGSCLKETYAKFRNSKIIGFKPIRNEKGNLVTIVELFHGPTGSFKDLSLSLIGRLMETFIARKKSHIILLVSTTCSDI
jgi:threonine synthase